MEKEIKTTFFKVKVFQRFAIYLASSGMEKFVQKILGLKTAKKQMVKLL